MNIVTIHRLDDLQEIVDELPHILNKISEETYHNMWCIRLDHDFICSITLKDLTFFLNRLIQERTRQIDFMNLKNDIIFYMWFDEQTLQLRFNIISGNLSSLPFRCKTRVIDTPKSILSNFINTSKNITLSGDHTEFFDIEDDWDQDDDEKDYILDVFVRVLNLKTSNI